MDKKTEIRVIIKDKKIEIALWEGEEKRDSLFFDEGRSLSRDLLLNLDEFLTRNKLTPQMVENFSLESDIDEPFTSYRIVKATISALNWAKKGLK